MGAAEGPSESSYNERCSKDSTRISFLVTILSLRIGKKGGKVSDCRAKENPFQSSFFSSDRRWRRPSEGI